MRLGVVSGRKRNVQGAKGQALQFQPATEQGSWHHVGADLVQGHGEPLIAIVDVIEGDAAEQAAVPLAQAEFAGDKGGGFFQ